MRAVQRAALDGNAQLGRLQNGVLLGVDSVAYLRARAGFNVELAAHAFAALLAGFESCGSPVVARGHDALVLDDDGADAASLHVAAGPFRNQISHFHKANIPFIHCVASHDACGHYTSRTAIWQ